MRARAFLLLGAITGCGLVSGLDGLEVVDGSADATQPPAEAGSDAPPIPDAGSNDAVVSFDAPPTIDAAGIKCGSVDCQAGYNCCVSGTTSFTYACDSKDCTGATASLRCDDKGDCNSGQICCFTGMAAGCQLSTNCANRLCANDAQCVSSACVAFDAGFGLSLKRCQ